MLNRQSAVKSIVLIEGAMKGIASNQLELEDIIQDHMPEGATEEWLKAHVVVYPLLSGQRLDLNYSIERDYDVEFDEGIEDDGVYTIDEHYGIEWDSMYSVEEFIKDSVQSGDFSMEEVERWTITKTMSSEIEVSFDLSELEITVDSYPETVAEFIEAEEPEVEPEENDKPLPLPIVSVNQHELSYVTQISANNRVRNGEPTYAMSDDGIGRLVFGMYELGQAIESGKSFARLVE